jgi:hypothetical protein
MRVALFQAERLGRVEAGVHAGDDSEPASWRHRQITLDEPRSVGIVCRADFVDDCDSSFPLAPSSKPINLILIHNRRIMTAGV